MIDEEDEEEILNKGISLKGALKNILVIILIMLGAFAIYFGGSEDTAGNWILGFMLICLGSTLMQVQKQQGEPIRQTLSILICKICGLTKVRNYENGDYVFGMSSDTCSKCNDAMKISQIYSVRLKKPTEPNTKGKSSREKNPPRIK